MALAVGNTIQFSYQGSTVYSGEIMSGNAVATGNLTISDGNAPGTYSNVTMYYNPNAVGIGGAVTGVYYIAIPASQSTDGNAHTYVNAINTYLQYDGTFTVESLASSGSSTQTTVTENVSFSAVSDTVIFQESGLPSGTNWTVTFNGTAQSSTTSTITFTGIGTGTYSFTVSASGYIANPSSGNVTVGGS